MPDTIFNSVIGETPAFGSLLLCTACSLAIGFAIAGIYMFRNQYSKSLAAALVLLPATVQVVIMLVNGNLGAGVAVAGAFSLVRFRSIPGSAKDIGSVFFAMAIGFIMGMGYLLYAVVFLALVGGADLLLTLTRFGRRTEDERTLRIVIPEGLDYDGLFDDVFERYAAKAELERVKTTNMGSLYELTYTVRLKAASAPKAFIDELRCRNGNLNILLSREQRGREEL